MWGSWSTYEQHAQGAPTQSTFAQAMGTSSNGRHSDPASRRSSALILTAHAGSLLAEHAGQSIRDKASLAVAGTVGGRLAAAISMSRNTRAEDVSDSGEQSDGAESDEVANFVNKNQTDD